MFPQCYILGRGSSEAVGACSGQLNLCISRDLRASISDLKTLAFAAMGNELVESQSTIKEIKVETISDIHMRAM